MVVDECVRGGDQSMERIAEGGARVAVGEHGAPRGPVGALGFGDADELADDGDRQRVGEVGNQIHDTVRAGVGRKGVEEDVGDLFDARAQPGDPAGGEGPDDPAAQPMMFGPVSTEQTGAQVLRVLGSGSTGTP
ncbi:hypothetical protein SPW_1835 [Streptomyces sp. W007]|nr:hypothetical protein SPW_1835 [Streptomyces sp. W007]